MESGVSEYAGLGDTSATKQLYPLLIKKNSNINIKECALLLKNLTAQKDSRIN